VCKWAVLKKIKEKGRKVDAPHIMRTTKSSQTGCRRNNQRLGWTTLE